jgi:hypothetical protein
LLNPKPPVDVPADYRITSQPFANHFSDRWWWVRHVDSGYVIFCYPALETIMRATGLSAEITDWTRDWVDLLHDEKLWRRGTAIAQIVRAEMTGEAPMKSD